MNTPEKTSRAIVVICDDCTKHDTLIPFVQNLWRVERIAIIPASAPETLFTTQGDKTARENLEQSITPLLGEHTTQAIAIVAHTPCTIPSQHHDQIAQLRESVDYLTTRYPQLRIAGISLDASGAPLKIEL